MKRARLATAAAAVIGCAVIGLPFVTAGPASAVPAVVTHRSGGAAPVSPYVHSLPRINPGQVAAEAGTAPRPASVGPLSSFFPACYGDSRPIASQGGRLNPSSFGAFYSCNRQVWTFELQTSDAWTPSQFGDVQFNINTDGDPSDRFHDNCFGSNYVAIVQQDPNVAGTFESVVLQLDASCNFAVVNEPHNFLTNGVAISFLQSAIGSAPSILWNSYIETYAQERAGAGGGHNAPAPVMSGGQEEFPLIAEAVTGPPPTCTASATTDSQVATTPDSHRAAAALRRAGFSSVHDYGEGIVSFTGDASAANRALAAAGLSSRVSPGHTFEPATVASPQSGTTTAPNDPGFPSQWNLAAVNAPGAWSVTTGNNVVVADIDTGADYTHPDLAANLVNGFDETTGLPTGPSTTESGNIDSNGHGTAVAGVIGAVTNNSSSLASLGWNTKVMPVKVAFGLPSTSGQIAAGILWAADTTQHPGNPVKVINLSLGGPCPDNTIESAIQTAQTDGILVVAAAGNNALNPVLDPNEGTNDAPSYPANEPNVIAVGATGHDGFRALYSNTGPYVTLAAPGGSADGTAADDIPLLKTGGGTTTEAGTSFAAPQVAATAALIWSENPDLTATQVAELIRSTATQLGPAGTDGLNVLSADNNNNTDIEYGTGLLNAGAALADTPPPASTSPTYGTFYSLPPTRILNTRSGLGHSGKVGANQFINLTVDGSGSGLIPASGVAAVVLNVTVTNPTAASFVTVWPTGQARPTASNINFVAGQTVPNLVTVKVGAGGQVSLYNAAGSTDLIADVAGYYGDGTAAAGSTFVPLPPGRLLDTRSTGGPITAGGPPRNLTVVGSGGVQPGATAAVLNVTVTGATAPSFLTVFPAGGTPPTASNLNFAAGQTVPNQVVVQLGTGGAITFFNAVGSVQVIVDVAGYFTAAGDATGSRFFPVVDHRILDTRTNTGGFFTPIAAGHPIHLAVTGQGGVIDGAAAVVANATVTGPTAAGFLTVFPTGENPPTASNLNFVRGQTVANLVSAEIGSGGDVDVFNAAGSVSALVDVAGWYGAAGA